MYLSTALVKYISSVFRVDSAGIPVKESDDVVNKIKDLIYSSCLNTTVTLLHPSIVSPLGNSIVCHVPNKSFLVKGVKLSTLCDHRFLSAWIVPKGLVVYNVTGNIPVNIDFFIDSAAMLHLKLDPEVYKTLGLSNCTETYKNNEGVVLLKINLKELSTVSGPTKLHSRIQKGLSQISQGTVIISSEKLNPISKDDLIDALRGMSDDTTVEELLSNTKYMKVPKNLTQESGNSNIDFDSLFSNDFKVVVGIGADGVDFKRRKVSHLDKRIHQSKVNLEKFLEHRNSIEKIYNTVEKNKNGRGSLIKDLIHELEQKNLHGCFEKEYFGSHPVAQLIKFIDLANLWAKSDLPLENIKTNTKDGLDFYRISNGIISSEYIFSLFKYACKLLSNGSKVFIISVYTLHNGYHNKPLICPEYYGGYIHIICNKADESNNVGVLIVKSH